MKKNFDSILNVSAIVLANLCVSYIMTSQNEEAEAGGISCKNRRFEQEKSFKIEKFGKLEFSMKLKKTNADIFSSVLLKTLILRNIDPG